VASYSVLRYGVALYSVLLGYDMPTDT
jgi:hypothetical protein